MAIKKRIEVEVEVTTGDLVREIKLFCGPLDLARALEAIANVFDAVTETMTNEGLADLQNFIGDSAFKDFATKVSAFEQRVMRVAQAAKEEDDTGGTTRSLLPCNEHCWNIPIVSVGSEGDTFVRRCCTKCKLEQVGTVERWRKPKPEEFSQTAEKAANK